MYLSCKIMTFLEEEEEEEEDEEKEEGEQEAARVDVTQATVAVRELTNI